MNAAFNVWFPQSCGFYLKYEKISPAKALVMMPQRAQAASSSYMKQIFAVIVCTTNGILSVAASICRGIFSVYSFFVKSVELDQKVRPTRKTVLYTLVGFLLFLVLGGFAIGHPVRGMRIAILATGISLFLGFSYFILLDFASNSMAGFLEFSYGC